MKKIGKITTLIFTFFLVSCNEQFLLNSSSKIDSSTNVSSSDILDSSENSSSLINESSSFSYKEEDLLTLELTGGFDIGNYDTGNCSNQYNGGDINTYKGFTFEHYRAVYSASNFMGLLPYHDSLEDGTIPGSFYNVTGIPGMVKIGIRYVNDSSAGDGIKLSYGLNVDVNNYTISDAVTSYKYVEFEVGLSNFFKIETTGKEVDIKEIKIYYTGEANDMTPNYKLSGTGDYRLNPTRYTEELIPGESTISVPAKIEVNSDGTYQIVEHKEYTYYDFEYVSNNPDCAKDAAMTDPKDVAAYYIAFRQYPANYYSSNNEISSYFSLFGKDTRRVSKIYSRTDGYVNAVPDDESNIQYVEFDIAIGDTYISNTGKVTRGVGRVVIFFSGFDATGYDNSPVAVYTDDHYATFQEYLNTGKYGKRFNAQCHGTAYKWGNSTTLN